MLDVSWCGPVPVVVGSQFGSQSSLAKLTFESRGERDQHLTTNPDVNHSVKPSACAKRMPALVQGFSRRLAHAVG